MEADEVRVGEALLQLRHVLALTVVRLRMEIGFTSTVSGRLRLAFLPSTCGLVSASMLMPEFATWPVASTTRSTSANGGVGVVEDQVVEVHRAGIAVGHHLGDLALGEDDALLLRAA